MEEVYSFLSQTKIPSNSCVLLRKGDFLFFSIENTGKYGLIGGKKNNGETPWETMKREYREETGNNLPRLTNIRKFMWKHHTAIYVGDFTGRLDLSCKRGDGELLGIKVMKKDEVLTEVSSGKFRSCCKYSIPALMKVI